MNIRITERDNKIFHLLFRLRYASSKQIAEYIDCKVKGVYDRVEKLIKANYIESNFASRINNKVYSNGCEIRKIHKIKSYKKKVKINNYTLKHHLEINDIFIHLVKNNVSEEDIVTEREIYWKKTGLTKRKKRITKVPDLVFKKNKEGREKLLALEIESTKKDKEMLRKIFTNYSINTTYYAVIYLTKTEGLRDYIRKTVKKERRTFIEAYTIAEFYEDSEKILTL